jgi:hypothetical protein
MPPTRGGHPRTTRSLTVTPSRPGHYALHISKVASTSTRNCDAFTAMTHHRPYAPQLTSEQALAELHRCAGQQFDPQVVAVLASGVAETAVAQPAQ